MSNLHNKVNTKQQAIHHVNNGEHAIAVTLLQNHIKKEPNDANAEYLLGCSLASLSRWDEAILALENCIRIQPDNPHAHYALSGVRIALNQSTEAISSLNKVLQLDDTLAEAHIAIAYLYVQQSNADEANAHINRALMIDQSLELNPKMNDLYIELARMEQNEGNHKNALSLIEKALKINPKNPIALCQMALSLGNLSHMKEAKSYYRKALRADPNNIEAKSGLALIYNFNGEYSKANNLIDPLLKNKIYNATLAIAFAQSCKVSNRCQEAIDYINKVLEVPGLPKKTIKSLYFSAANALERLGSFDAAFNNYQSANESMPTSYDSMTHKLYIDQLIDVFTPGLFMATPRAQNNNSRPIFIVGMPRSGTSLTEQILAAHPSVYAAGELSELHAIMKNMQQSYSVEQNFPIYIKHISQDNINRMAQSYLGKLTGLSKKALRVTDKMPHNFLLVGLIQILFPCARIIHCRRNPMDTCLSIYFQDFNEDHKYARDLYNIGTHYHQYQRLMDYWNKVITLPILDVSYEELVSDNETAIRHILDFCELEWDNRCLMFHDVQRTVLTASVDQVRQPIYTRSVERWRKYEQHLDDLKNGLREPF